MTVIQTYWGAYVPQNQVQPVNSGNPIVNLATQTANLVNSSIPAAKSDVKTGQPFMTSTASMAAAKAQNEKIAAEKKAVVEAKKAEAAEKARQEAIARERAVPVGAQTVTMQPQAQQVLYVGAPREYRMETRPGYDVGAASHYGMSLQEGDGINPMMAAALNRVNQEYNQSAIDAQGTLAQRQMMMAASDPNTHKFAQQLMSKHGLGADEAWKLASTEAMANNGYYAGLGASYRPAQEAIDAANRRGVDSTLLYGGTNWQPMSFSGSGLHSTNAVSGLRQNSDGSYNVMLGDGRQISGLDATSLMMGQTSPSTTNVMQTTAGLNAATLAKMREAEVQHKAVELAKSEVDKVQSQIANGGYGAGVDAKDVSSRIKDLRSTYRSNENFNNKNYDRDRKEQPPTPRF